MTLFTRVGTEESEMLNHFRDDNTSGYNEADLAELNEAFERSVGLRLSHPANIFSRSLGKLLEDRIAEEILFAFDQGLRGAALVR